MTSGKVKSIEKTQKAPESSGPIRSAAHHPNAAVQQTGFDAALGPQMAGNLAVQQLFRAGAIQAKLSISQPNNPDEQEADRVADHVMRMAEPGPINLSHGVIHRKCAACDAGGATCPKCEEEEKVHRKEASGHSIHASSAVHSQIAALRGGGQPLAPSVRAFFEPRFGRDFSGVRVHTDSRAQESAQAIQARAFTAGQDIAFGTSEFDPEKTQGRRLLAHELTHVVQQGKGVSLPGLIQRDSPPAPLPSPNPSNAPAAALDPANDLVEREGKAFDVAKGRGGQAAATVLFSNPVSPDTKDSPKFETFTVGEVIDRHSGDPIRHGFDAQGPATAYIALMGGDVGGVVLQQDKFFFAAKLNKGSKKLRVTDPSVSEWDWWAGRDHVYRVTAFPGVASVTGMGGFVFPLGKDLMDDPAKTRFLKDPNMATPADAQSMRDIAGVPPIGQDGKSSSKLPDQVAIPEDQQEPFILAYFRARGLETLSYNEKETNRLAEVFKATDSGSQTKDPSGVSAEAKKIIAADREQLKVYSKLLEEEAQVEAMLSFLKVCEERGEFPPFYPLYVKPQKAQVVGMSAIMKGRQVDIQRRKIGLLAVSPVLGQLVGMPDPKSRFKEAERIQGNIIENLEIPKVRGTSYASLDESLLAKPASAENEEAIRKQMPAKLDAVLKAIRDTRSEMFGAPDFLLGMEGLRLLVKQDLSSITAKNASMNNKLITLLQTHATDTKSWKEAEFVIQIGLLFIPGAGPFLSAAAGFAMSAAQMSTALRRWTASQASVNPATALVDQQTAEAQLTQDTIDLTINSVFLATEAINALKTMEAAGGTKKMEGTLKQLEEKEVQEVAKAATKGEGVRFQRTIGGRTLKYTESGHLVVCSSPCDFLFHRYEDVLDAASRTHLTDIDTRLKTALGAGNVPEAERIFEEALQIESELHGKFADLLKATEGTRVGGGPAAHLLGDHGPDVTNKHLIDRVNVAGAPMASRFTDARKMEIAIADTLGNYRPQINTWLATSPAAGTNMPALRFNPGLGDLGIAYQWDAALGRAVQVTDTLETCLVVVKSDGRGGFVIQTSYPVR